MKELVYTIKVRVNALRTDLLNGLSEAIETLQQYSDAEIVDVELEESDGQ